jgi:hypothetical protein
MHRHCMETFDWVFGSGRKLVTSASCGVVKYYSYDAMAALALNTWHKEIDMIHRGLARPARLAPVLRKPMT